MNIKEIWKETREYAKPVAWKIFWFNLLLFITYATLFIIATIIPAIITFITHNKQVVNSLYILLSLCAIVLSTLIFFNSSLSIFQYIIDTRNNKNPKFSSLWKNTVSFNKRYLTYCVIGTILLSPFMISLALLMHFTPEKSLLQPIYSLLLCVCLSEFCLGFYKLFFSKVTPMKACLYGYKVGFSKLIIYLSIPTIILWLIGLPINFIPDNHSSSHILTAIGAIYSLIVTFISLFSIPYLVSYFLIIFYKYELMKVKK